jgi:hypothetical protein
MGVGYSFRASNPKLVQKLIRTAARGAGVEFCVRDSHFGTCGFGKWLKNQAKKGSVKDHEISSEECAAELKKGMQGGDQRKKVYMEFKCDRCECDGRSDYVSGVETKLQRKGRTKKTAQCDARVKVIYDKSSEHWVVSEINNVHKGHSRGNSRVEFTDEMLSKLYTQ